MQTYLSGQSADLRHCRPNVKTTSDLVNFLFAFCAGHANGTMCSSSQVLDSGGGAPTFSPPLLTACGTGTSSGRKLQPAESPSPVTSPGPDTTIPMTMQWPVPAMATWPMATRTFTRASEDFLNPELGVLQVGLNLRSGQGAPRSARAARLASPSVRLDTTRASRSTRPPARPRGGFADAPGALHQGDPPLSYNASFTADASRTDSIGHIGQARARAARQHVPSSPSCRPGSRRLGVSGTARPTPRQHARSHRDILEALLAAVPSNRAIQVRTPMFKAESYGSSAPLADRGVRRDRPRPLGHTTLASSPAPAISGTYASPSRAGSHTSAEGRYTPIGVRDCKVSAPRCVVAPARCRYEARHWSFLNRRVPPESSRVGVDDGCLAEVHAGLATSLRARRGHAPGKATAGGDSPSTSPSRIADSRPRSCAQGVRGLTKGSERHVWKWPAITPIRAPGRGTQAAR